MSIANVERPQPGVVVNDATRSMLLDLVPKIAGEALAKVDVADTVPIDGPAREAAIAQAAADQAMRETVAMLGFTLEPPIPPKPRDAWAD